MISKHISDKESATLKGPGFEAAVEAFDVNVSVGVITAMFLFFNYLFLKYFFVVPSLYM